MMYLATETTIWGHLSQFFITVIVVFVIGDTIMRYIEGKRNP